VLVARNFNIRDGELDLSSRFFTTEEEYRQRVAREEPLPGDIIFSREAPVGEAAIIPEGTRLSLGQRTMLFRPDRDRVLPEFLLTILYTPDFQRAMQLRSSGVTAPHLNVADVRNLLVPVPALETQRRIARSMAAVQSAIRAAVKSHGTRQQLFRSALMELLGAAG
jgi:type I restriction enzyme S subunit